MALATASVLLAWTQRQDRGARPWAGLLQRLGDGSYALFVSHFAVILFMSAIWESQAPEGVEAASLYLLAAWLLALGVGHGVDRLSQGLTRWAWPMRG